MNENYVVQIINALAEKFGLAIDWTSQNVMPYVQELMGRIVNHEICMSTFWMIFVPALTVCFGIASWFLYRYARKKDSYAWDETPAGAIAIICFIACCCCVVATCIVIPIFTTRIIECVNIPEKIFMEYIGQYLN